jgi:hypothetical protein
LIDKGKGRDEVRVIEHITKRTLVC